MGHMGSATHYTDTEGVEENAIHPHSHFHNSRRGRINK